MPRRIFLQTLKTWDNYLTLHCTTGLTQDTKLTHLEMITFLARLYTTLVTRSSWPWTLLSSAGAMTPAKSISLLSLPLGEARARVSLCLLSRALQGRILYDQFVYYYFIFWGKVFFLQNFPNAVLWKVYLYTYYLRSFFKNKKNLMPQPIFTNYF